MGKRGSVARKRGAKETEVVVVGAGQAGLSLGHELGRRGVAHEVLERGRVGERWDSERWDSLTLLTPNWLNRLRGGAAHADADGFLGHREFFDYLRRYANSSRASIREAVDVLAVEQRGDRFHVHTDSGDWLTRSVVVATGDAQTVNRPPQASTAPPWLVQVDANRYRTPGQLPAGGVLVVGAGASGQQIASELRRSGRRVVIAVGRHTRMPRRYRGKDIWEWMQRIGDLEQAIDEVPDPIAARRAPSGGLSGRNGGEDLDLGRLDALGITVTGRLADWDGATVQFSDNLGLDLHDAELRMRRLLERIDDHVEANRDQLSGVPPREQVPPITLPVPASALDLGAERIAAVVWATGYRRTYPWLHLPVFDSDGEIEQRYGITPVIGLYVLGIRFQRRRASHLIGGVGADAAYLADDLTTCRHQHQSTATRPCVPPRRTRSRLAATA